MKVSIITAIYDADDTLTQSVNSVNSQSYENIEHILIISRPSNATLKLIDNIKTKNTKVFFDDKLGIYNALNKGIDHAQGDIIGFVHSDDYLNNNHAIEYIVDAFKEHDAECVYGNLDIVSKSNPNKIIRHWKSGTFSSSKLKYGWMPPHPALYLKKSVFETYGKFDSAYKISGDYDFTLRYFNKTKGKIIYIPLTFYKMRYGGISSIKLFQKMQEDYSAIRRNNAGGSLTLIYKNLSKFKQFLNF